MWKKAGTYGQPITNMDIQLDKPAPVITIKEKYAGMDWKDLRKQLPGTVENDIVSKKNEKGEYIYDLMKPEISFYFDSAMKYIHSSDYNVTAPAQFSAFYNASNVSGYIGYVLLYIAIAAVFLYFAGRLAKKQEHSVDGLYFPFAKYVFAAAVSIAMGIVLLQNAIAWWHRMLIGILIIGIFVVLVYHLDPERKLTKRQKVGVVK